MAGWQMQRNIEVARYQAGSTDPSELDAAISQAWSDALADENDRAKIQETLSPLGLAGAQSPFATRVSGSGLTGAEILIIFAASFAGSYAKELGETAGKAAADLTIEKARKLWSIIRKRMLVAEPEVLGSELD
jgi:hypothetical protein